MNEFEMVVISLTVGVFVFTGLLIAAAGIVYGYGKHEQMKARPMSFGNRLYLSPAACPVCGNEDRVFLRNTDNELVCRRHFPRHWFDTDLFYGSWAADLEIDRRYEERI